LRNLDQISGDVIDVALRIHKELGPGLLESVYEIVLAGKLAALGYKIDRQVPVEITFEDMRFENAFRIDLLVDDRLIVEIKSVEQLTGAHAKQVLTYLRLTRRPLGLLINFSGETLREGIRRLVNNHKPLCASAPLRDQ